MVFCRIGLKKNLIKISSFSIKGKSSQGERVKQRLVMSGLQHRLVISGNISTFPQQWNPGISAWSDGLRPIKTLHTSLRHHLSKPQKHLYCQHWCHTEVVSISSLILKTNVSTSSLKSQHIPVRISRAFIHWQFLFMTWKTANSRATICWYFQFSVSFNINRFISQLTTLLWKWRIWSDVRCNSLFG